MIPFKEGKIVQCCRCRNKHYEKDRKEKRIDRISTLSVCPRCGAHTYFLEDKNGREFEAV